MKKAIFILAVIALAGCSKNDDSSTTTEDRDFKQDMRNFVIGISQKAKTANPNFAVIPQNGIELVSSTGEEGGSPAIAYLDAIDGNGQEDLLYGYDNDDQATKTATTAYLKSFLDISKNAGNTIFVTDYCSTASKMANSYTANQASGYVSYAAPDRDLAVIPSGQPNNVNSDNITQLSQAKNFIFFINPVNYATKADFIAAVNATNYDAIIMDLFLEDEQFTTAEIAELKHKANGGSRLIICYMSIGEAEEYRYYWNTLWNSSKPEWIAAENPGWPGNYKVKYWNNDWQGIIYKNSDSYLDKITTAGFDGVYLDIIDAFEYFEE
ncbi:endo alpha-1,4 polygalactosaminidase [Flavobacterium sp. RHBU_24]|uniref:endo alpha-1,4 polygalactosaminidase n=1 Tax=Flavobacterium sp. RHBU_24 TaxID=3391185 RepID=UPI00398519B2